MNIMEFFGARFKHDILDKLPETIGDYVPVFVFGIGNYPQTNDIYYEWKNIEHQYAIQGQRVFRIPRNMLIINTDASLQYPTERKVIDIIANYPQVLLKNEQTKEVVKMMERDPRMRSAIENIYNTSRLYIEGDYYDDVLLTFEYNVFETVREYFRQLRGEDPSTLDYFERMSYLSKLCKMSGVYIGTTEAKSRDIFSLFDGKYRIEEHADFVQYHSMIPKFSEMTAISLNVEEERFQNAIMITLTTDTPPRLLCADIYRDFKYIEYNDDIGMSVLSLYGYSFPMKHPPEEVSYIASNYEIYVQTLDIKNCEYFPLRCSRLLEVIRERIGEKKIVIYPFLNYENTSSNSYLREKGIQNMTECKKT